MQSQLSSRQYDQANQHLSIVEDFGQWNKGPKSEGAHYFFSDDNPFIFEGMVCGNCIFHFDSANNMRCQLVEGKIDHEGLCKLWIIPNELLEV